MPSTKTTKKPSFKQLIDELSVTLDAVMMSTENEAQDNILADVLEEKLEILNRRT
jgi:hypothetical protein